MSASIRIKAISFSGCLPVIFECVEKLYMGCQITSVAVKSAGASAHSIPYSFATQSVLLNRSYSPARTKMLEQVLYSVTKTDSQWNIAKSNKTT